MVMSFIGMHVGHLATPHTLTSPAWHAARPCCAGHTHAYRINGASACPAGGTLDRASSEQGEQPGAAGPAGSGSITGGDAGGGTTATAAAADTAAVGAAAALQAPKSKQAKRTVASADAGGWRGQRLHGCPSSTVWLPTKRLLVQRWGSAAAAAGAADSRPW